MIILDKEKIKKYLINEIKEWIEAIIIVSLIYFVILPFIFGTKDPVLIVASCSEYPYLTIGDVIFIKKTNINDINVQTAIINDSTKIIPIIENKTKIIGFNINGKNYYRNDSYPIIAYRLCNEYGCVDIIHRVFLKVIKNNKTYLITWGDNNKIPDQYDWINFKFCIDQKTNYCLSKGITQENLRGEKTLITIPLIGHIKMFFCDITHICPGHSNIGTGGKYQLTCEKRV